jgi:hypothetical protein
MGRFLMGTKGVNSPQPAQENFYIKKKGGAHCSVILTQSGGSAVPSYKWTEWKIFKFPIGAHDNVIDFDSDSFFSSADSGFSINCSS